MYFYPRSPCGERPVTSVARVATTVISIHALLAESDYDTSSLMQCQAKFLSTLSLRRATGYGQYCIRARGISIHALLAESDVVDTVKLADPVLFLSTLSLRRATVHYDNYNLHCVISIHALLAESDHDVSLNYKEVLISIHALLAESDPAG